MTDFIWTLGFFWSHLIAWTLVAHIFPLFSILYVTYIFVIWNSFCSQPSTFDIIFQVVHILIVLISSSLSFECLLFSQFEFRIAIITICFYKSNYFYTTYDKRTHIIWVKKKALIWNNAIIRPCWACKWEIVGVADDTPMNEMPPPELLPESLFPRITSFVSILVEAKPFRWGIPFACQFIR